MAKSAQVKSQTRPMTRQTWRSFVSRRKKRSNSDSRSKKSDSSKNKLRPSAARNLQRQKGSGWRLKLLKRKLVDRRLKKRSDYARFKSRMTSRRFV